MARGRPGTPARIALVAVSFALCVVLIEWGLESAGVSYSPLQIDVHGEVSDWRFQHSFADRHFEFDPEQIWRPVAGTSVFNSRGYRGRVLESAPPPGEVRVLALGDSNTLGWGNEEIHWPRYLEEELAQQGYDIAVVNAGVWGHSAYQGMARLDALLPLEPDVVLISYGGNDAHRVLVSDADYVERVVRSPIRPFLYDFAIGRLVLKALDASASPGSEPAVRELVFRVSPEEYEEYLGRMVETARSHGAQVYLLTRPFFGESPRESWWKSFAPRYVASTHAVGRRLGVPVIDVHAAFQDHPELFVDESHFNETGHRRAAKLIAEPVAAGLTAPGPP